MNKEWSSLTRNDFIRLHKEHSGREVAKMYGVTPGAVYYRFRMFGISPPRKTARKFVPPIEELKSLYQTMSMADLAKHYGVGETTIFMHLKEHGIGGISRSERLAGKPKSLEHRLAMSRSFRESGAFAGEKNPNWKGGRSSRNVRERSKAAYFEWKNAVLAKAGWKCELCGLEHGHVCECCGHRVLLHAHHLTTFSERPELRYEPSNGKSLCERCHRQEHHK